MNKLRSIIKQLNIGNIITSSLFVVMLWLTTIGNFGSEALAENVSNNNINFHSNLPASNLIAASNNSKTTYPTNDKNVDGLLYSDTNDEKSLDSVEDLISPQTKKLLLDPTQIPAKQQPIIDRSNPDNKLLEKTGQMFDDSGVLD